MKDHTNIMLSTAAFLVNHKLRWKRLRCDVIKSTIMTSLKELRHIEIEFMQLLNSPNYSIFVRKETYQTIICEKCMSTKEDCVLC